LEDTVATDFYFNQTNIMQNL